MRDAMTATELWERDARFRMRVTSAVSRAMAELRIDRLEEIRTRDANEVATLAAVLALKDAFDGDAELTATRIERDHYQNLALNGLATRPITAVFGGRASGKTAKLLK